MYIPTSIDNSKPKDLQNFTLYEDSILNDSNHLSWQQYVSKMWGQNWFVAWYEIVNKKYPENMKKIRGGH